MRVSIIGTGYVGIVTGACLAEKGHEVVCVDIDEGKVERINRGEAPIREEGLDPLLKRHAGRLLKATTDLAAAVRGSELTLIAVGTPFDGRAIDLAQVKGAARAIGAALREKDAFHTVVVKSTVVPGTTDDVVRPLLEEASGKRAGQGFGVGMNPEFLTEGEAVSDFMDPDRLVLGAGDPKAMAALEALYAGFPAVPVVRTTPKTAEMIKYASNTLLATLISYSNELANLAQALGGIDYMDVVEGMRTSRYLSAVPAAAPSGWIPAGPADSPNEALAPAGTPAPAPIAAFLVPGCGFGGSCLPKDTAALIAHGKAVGASMRVLEAVRDVNLAQPARMAQLLARRIPDLKGVPVAVLGLAFRPGTGDLRESPAIPIARDLLARGAQVRAFDPAVAEEMAELADPAAHPASRLFEGQVRLCSSLEEAVAGARGVLLVTRWPEFRRLPDLIAGLKGAEERPVVVDGRRLLDKDRIARYEGIGL